MRKSAAVAFFTAAFAPALIADTTLEILHFNDPESHLTATAVNATNAPALFIGGASTFVARLEELRRESAADGVLTVCAGDDFLCGMEHDAGDSHLNRENPRDTNYDALFFAAAKVDAAIPGNHDFDLGPERFEQFLDAVHEGKSGAIPGFGTSFLCCNLDVSEYPELTANLTPATIVSAGKIRIGIVGDITCDLPEISSPGMAIPIDADGDGDRDLDDIAVLVQRQIDRLTAEDVDKIILVSHLQSIRNDQSLIRKLHGVDVAISGGGHERLGNGTFPNGFSGSYYGPYPLLSDKDGKLVLDADGVNVPVVTAGSALEFVGRLFVKFNDKGRVISCYGDTLPVRTTNPTRENAIVYKQVEKPVSDFVQSYGNAIIAVSEVVLDRVRDHSRSRETNFGDLVADALLCRAREYARERGMKPPKAAVVNGGSIRGEEYLTMGPVTHFQLRETLPFRNYVTIVENVSPTKFKALAEHMVENVEELGGGFGQIAGFRFVYAPNAEKGRRIIEVSLDDGTEIVKNGKVLKNAPSVSFATLDFLAHGGDGYPFETGKKHFIGVTEETTVSNYMENNLGGIILEKIYPESGTGRISISTNEGNE